MLDFLFVKKERETAKDKELNAIYSKLKEEYPEDNIPELRKKYLQIRIFNLFISKSPG